MFFIKKVSLKFMYSIIIISEYATIRLHYQNLPDHRKQPLFLLIKTLKDLQILPTGMMTKFVTLGPNDEVGCSLLSLS